MEMTERLRIHFSPDRRSWVGVEGTLEGLFAPYRRMAKGLGVRTTCVVRMYVR